ncbi:hypothetical protein [Chthonobacter rhizosphaerae]|uniref:hypothetical protein n=1 Tax=Chthonobacter rhizosphaerae TaxID=2735553 RepID=UPI0015EFA97A|nr:hypothetical protein [Chthonobacter rhizosphaerae]
MLLRLFAPLAVTAVLALSPALAQQQPADAPPPPAPAGEPAESGRMDRLERILTEMANRPVIVSGLNVNCSGNTPNECARQFCIDAGYADGKSVATIPARPLPPNPALLTVVACRPAPIAD